MSRFNPKTILSKDPKDLSSKTKRRKDATLAMLAPDIVDTDPQVQIDWLLISDYKQLKTVNTWHPPPHLKWINIAFDESSTCHPDYCFHSFNRKTTETQPLLRPISPRQLRLWKMISPRTNSSLSCCMSLGDRNSHLSRYELVLLLKLS